MISLTPKVHPLILEFLEGNGAKKLFSTMNAPVHIIFPQVFAEQIRSFKKEFTEAPLRIYFATKANSHPSLLRTAVEEKIGLDVSTEGELDLALGLGCEDIECTGPKNTYFIRKAISSSCLISIDSLDELRKVTRYSLELQKKTKIIIRVADPSCYCRNVAIKQSRFGIAKTELPEVYKIISSCPYLSAEGFHFHGDGYDTEMKSGFVHFMLDQIEDLYALGQKPNYINIGGAFRESTLDKPTAWNEYISYLESCLINKTPLPVWGSDPYGLKLNEHGKVAGRGKAESFASDRPFIPALHELFNTCFEEGLPLQRLLQDTGISLVIEPGFSLASTAGISAMKVIGTKISPQGEDLLILDGNMFSLSSRMIEPIADPKLISQSHNPDSQESYSCYLVGSLCREDDIIMRRKVIFPHKPMEGDVILFFCTGAYNMWYEQCTPQRHKLASYVVAKKEGANWGVKEEKI